MLYFLISVLYLKYSIKFFTVDITVSTRHPRFNLSVNEVNSGSRCPVPFVHAMNEYAIPFNSQKIYYSTLSLTSTLDEGG